MFLPQDELMQVRETQEAVWGKSIPRRVLSDEGGAIRLQLLRSMSALDRDYRPGQDIWLLYRSREDVALWAVFLGVRLPRMLAALDAWDGKRVDG